MATGRANSVEVIFDRGRIIGLWESGMPTREFALTTGVSQRSVQRWIKRFEEEGSLHTKPRSGRPRVTTPVNDARILDAIEHQPLTSTVHHTLSFPVILAPPDDGSTRQIFNVISRPLKKI
ncbi:hypothetical protein Pmani_033245 [Petrolisthes manimaculis]|uniref:Insertion element IS150 protein InsJ-like helix-turn-helix domain-containing protein n=1 Tax=Petrolisthes manimaculis TaxID=1843537 RepID=A0AAE1NQ08_9EUCA|nr:hypothetical protein Pmani_033245 [Petrolisthes manimaculis]